MYLSIIGLFAIAVILGMALRRGSPQPQGLGISAGAAPTQE